MFRRKDSGLWIVVEGADGAGKTTLVKMLRNMVTSDGSRPLLVTKSPSDDKIGDLIRSELDGGPDCMRSMYLMFMADMIDEHEMAIMPMLNEGNIVISDRWLPSTQAYSSVIERKKGFDRSQVRLIGETFRKFVPSEREPDIYLLMKTPVRERLSRLATRDSNDWFDSLGESFQSDIDSAYSYIAELDKDRWSSINTYTDVGLVRDHAVRILYNKLGGWSIKPERTEAHGLRRG